MALSELHIALIGAGATGVLLVWGYNVWQDRKHRKTAERIFSGGKPDALAPEPAPQAPSEPERQEPTLAPPPDDELQASPVAPIDPVAEPIADIQVPEPIAEGAPGYVMDEIADCNLRFSSPTPIAAPIVHSIQRVWAAAVSKPISWRARGATGGWTPVAADDDGGYREWAVSLQLVDRRGPVSEAELSEFLGGVQAIAQQTGATLETTPDPEEILAHANALDQFCAGVDIQFVLHVVDATGGTFVGTKLRGLAEAAGMVLDVDGLFHSRDAAGVEEFSLGNLGAERFDAESLRGLVTHGLTFSLDVPRVVDGRLSFEKMLAVARQIGTAMGGILVDAQRAPLSDAMIAAIRAKTIELQQRMRDGGIDPGSPRALRLFS